MAKAFYASLLIFVIICILFELLTLFQIVYSAPLPSFSYLDKV